MRVCVTGGRDYGDRRMVGSVLSTIDVTVLIHGAARGADRLAYEWAKERGIEARPFPANWKLYGRGAGPIRNALMLDIGKPDLVVAFPGNDGTADCVRQARKRGIPVREVFP